MFQIESLPGSKGMKKKKVKKERSKKLKIYSNINKKNITYCEQVFKNALLEFNFRFAHQKVIEPFIVDFFFPDIKLIVEIDGPSHDKTKEYDQNREDYLRAKNYRFIRFKNDQVLNDLPNCLAKILEFKKPWVKGVRFTKNLRSKLCGHGKIKKWCCDCRYRCNWDGSRR